MWRLFKKSYDNLIQNLADLMEIDYSYGCPAADELDQIDDLLLKCWNKIRDKEIENGSN